MPKILFITWLIMISPISMAAPFNHDIWDGLLKKYVVVQRNGQATNVNYAGFKQEHKQLKQYLTNLSQVTPETFYQLKKEEQLAFLINAYNAWTVELIVSRYPELTSIKDLGSFFESPWKKSFITLLGKTRSLDNIEHDLIRGDYQEPRIHFAVNCASIGCPALRNEAYLGSRLNEQLEQATKNFIGDKQRNRLKGETLEVSSIFKWYRGDFEKGWHGYSSLEQFFSVYKKELGLSEAQAKKLLSGDIDIEFLDYDWRLNRT